MILNRDRRRIEAMQWPQEGAGRRVRASDWLALLCVSAFSLVGVLGFPGLAEADGG